MSHAFSGVLLNPVQVAPTPASHGYTSEVLWDEDRKDVGGSATNWAPVIASALLTIKNECNRDGWDGPGSHAISDVTISLAEEIAACLFTSLRRQAPPPDVIPEADGEICMSWSVDRDYLFSLSIGEHGKINYMGQFGIEGAQHGWQPVDASNRVALEASLGDVIRQLNRLFPQFTLRRAA